MTTSISDTIREKAIDIVQRAYAEGRINEPELEHRLGLILEANSPQQLRMAIADLPAPPRTLAPTQPGAVATGLASSSTDTAALIHFTGLFSGPIGPGLAWLATKNGSVVNREAAKALNYQILAAAGFVVGGMLSFLGLGFPLFLWTIGWMALTIISVVKANRGEDWENPLTQITGFRPITY